jgi:putative membrane protein
VNPRLRTALKIAAAVYGIWYVVGFVLMATDWAPKDLSDVSRVWGDVVFLLLAGLVTFLSSAQLCGVLSAAKISGVVILVSAGAELLGARVGFPFGQYQYTENLGPLLLDLMPWIIPICWLTIVLNSFWVIYFLFQRHLADPSARFLMFIVSSLVAVLTDFNLEPVASLVKLYWIWFDPGIGYLGIPGVNFFGWWMVSFMILYLADRLLPEKFAMNQAPWASYAILVSINFLFAVINLRAGFYLPVFVALNTFGLLGILLYFHDLRPKSG